MHKTGTIRKEISDHKSRLEDQIALLPTPVAQPSGNTPEDHLRKKPGRTSVTDLAILIENNLLSSGGKLLPTPNSYEGQRGGPQHPDKKRAGGHQVNLSDVAAFKLLPTPTAQASKHLADDRGPGTLDDGNLWSIAGRVRTRWGEYEAAVRRWERIFERVAPEPTSLSARGKSQLSPAFVEWMMGLDEGQITSIEGISRANQLKMLGNGVVPQQALAALQLMTERVSHAEAA